jgi:hypothetical protein
MMLSVAALLSAITTEAMSTAYVIAFLTVGPLAALLGGMLRRGRTTVASAGVALLVMTGSATAQETTPVTDPSKTTYGEKSSHAPQELNAFAFLIGTWDGRGRTKLPNGKVAEYPVRWVGRYILDGTAIADEGHAIYPDGRPSLGITFRQYDASRAIWVIEFLNVSESFLRRQVRQGAGSVAVQGRNVTVSSEAPGVAIREHYLVPDDDNWVYRLDMSNDGGENWNDGVIEFTFRRSK